MRLTLRSLVRSSVIASLVSMGVWYACPAAADDAKGPAASVDKKKDGAQSLRPEIKWTPPEKNVLVPEAAAPEVKAQNDDYYSRRAKKILEAERAGAVSVHPLAAANPGQQPVICDGGCTVENKAEIVYSKPKETVVGKMLPSSSGPHDAKQPPAAPATSTSIDCIAGCYEGTRSWPARPPAKVSAVMPPKATAADKSKFEKSSNGEWSTAVSREPARDHLSPVR